MFEPAQDCQYPPISTATELICPTQNSLAFDCNRSKHTSECGSSFNEPFDQFRIDGTSGPVWITIYASLSRVRIVL